MPRSEGRWVLAGAVQRDTDQAFWTLTLWRDEHAMRAFGASGAHRKAMPHLANWADAASVAHWLQPGKDLPDWPAGPHAAYLPKAAPRPYATLPRRPKRAVRLTGRGPMKCGCNELRKRVS